MHEEWIEQEIDQLDSLMLDSEFGWWWVSVTHYAVGTGPRLQVLRLIRAALQGAIERGAKTSQVGEFEEEMAAL